MPPQPTKGYRRAGPEPVVYPLVDEECNADKRFRPLETTTPAAQGKGTGTADISLWPTVPDGTFGITLSLDNEDKQIPIFLPADPRIFASNRGNPHASTMVYDLKNNEIDVDRGAPLHGLTRVVKNPRGNFSLSGAPSNTLAWNIGTSGQSDCVGGLMADDHGSHTQYGHISVRNGGPIDISPGKCKHKFGETEDGDPISASHISTYAFFRGDDKHDGPLDFQNRYPDKDYIYQGPIKMEAWIGYDGDQTYSWPRDSREKTDRGVWKVWTTGYTWGDGPPTTKTPGGGDVPPPPPPPPPPTTGGGETGGPTTPGNKVPIGGGPGGGVPGGGGGPGGGPGGAGGGPGIPGKKTIPPIGGPGTGGKSSGGGAGGGEKKKDPPAPTPAPPISTDPDDYGGTLPGYGDDKEKEEPPKPWTPTDPETGNRRSPSEGLDGVKGLWPPFDFTRPPDPFTNPAPKGYPGFGNIPIDPDPDWKKKGIFPGKDDPPLQWNISPFQGAGVEFGTKPTHIGLLEQSFAGQNFRATYVEENTPDLKHIMFPTQADINHYNYASPTTLKIQPYAVQIAGGGWSYTQTPGKSVYSGGTSPGGIALFPPENDMVYASDAYSTSYFVFTPGVKLAFGTPDVSTGGIVNGHTISGDNGDLAVVNVSPAGVENEKIRLNSDCTITLNQNVTLNSATADTLAIKNAAGSGAGNLTAAEITGTKFKLAAPQNYTTSSVTTTRVIDGSSADLDATRNVLATLINDLITAGLLQ